MNNFITLVESSLPFPLNKKIEIELDEEQKQYIKDYNLVFPKNTTLLLVSLDELIKNFKNDPKFVGTSLKTFLDNLELSQEQLDYAQKIFLAKDS